MKLNENEIRAIKFYQGDVMGADREYTGTIRLGVKSNTNDLQGELVETHASCDFSQERLDDAAKEWRGDIFQTEPCFCAVRREGSAAYEIADTGEHKPFLSHVYRFDVKPREGGRSLAFSLTGTKGVLPRVLAHDFGQTLGCGAVGGSSSYNNISPMDLINIRRVAWDSQVKHPNPAENADLVELLTERIMQRLGKQG